MTPVCRTPDCDHSTLPDTLGFCPECRHDYLERRTRAAEVSSALCEQHPELFARLSKHHAHELAQHLVAHASEGECGFYARFWAGMDFIREARELRAQRELAHQFISQRRRLRGVSKGAGA